MVCLAAGVEAVIDGFLLPVKKFVELDPFVDGADDSLTCCLESEVSASAVDLQGIPQVVANAVEQRNASLIPVAERMPTFDGDDGDGAMGGGP